MILLPLLYCFLVSYSKINNVYGKSMRATSVSDDLLVETQLGNIRGVRADDGDYNMFLGIPYARINESNIFGTSIPNPQFEGIFDANDDTARCPQIEDVDTDTVNSLDCLTLNIFVPDSATLQSPLPIMVYIYGGAFNIGYAARSSLGPKYLVRHNVIIITINYRLGAYGFLCLDKPEVAGNQGLKDQVAALRWIQNNIRSFGGDPNKVTVFGNSAGAMSIGYHLISETETLFTHAILQSGSAFESSVDDVNPSILLTIAANLGLQTNDVDVALALLSNTDLQLVLEASAGMWIGPCIEKKFSGVERLLSERAINSNHSKAANVQIMLGFNSDEALVRFQHQETPDAFVTWQETFSSILQRNFQLPEEEFLKLEGILRRFYIGDQEINNDVRHELAQISGDSMFVYPPVRSIKHFLNAGTDKVFQYVFSHSGERNLHRASGNTNDPGAMHADEIPYLFQMDFITEEPNAEDQLVIDIVTAMWTNFAKYSDPTPNTSVLLPVKWEPITIGSPYYYLNITTELNVGRRYENRRMTFLDLLYDTYAKYEIGYGDENEEEEEDSGPGDGGNGQPGSASAVFLSPILILAILINLF